MRVAVVLTARASWAKLEPVCRALTARPEVELQIIACASALLERYGKVVDVVKNQGYDIAAECWTVHEGETLLTSAKETGALLSELAPVLHRLQPRVVVVCADRHEVLAAAQAARYQHITLAHLQGGELSGSLDDVVRNSITTLADLHLVATERAAMRVYGLTGSHAITVTGCPSIDLAKQALSEPLVTANELGGAGAPIDLAKPFITILHHPTTDEVDHADQQMAMVMGCQRSDLPMLVFWPGQDAGAGAMSKEIRRIQAHVHTVRNLPPLRFLRLLQQSACLVGNSSAGIREASYLGVPVVNVGRRQLGRERGPNVVDVDYNGSDIIRATSQQIAHGPYRSSALYGSGHSGEKIAEVICQHSVSFQQGPAAAEFRSRISRP